MKRQTIVLLLLSTLLGLGACQKKNGPPGGNNNRDSVYFGRLSFVVEDNYTFSDYYAALVQSGYSDTLTAGAGPYTILVPNNDALTASSYIGRNNGVNYFLQVTDPSLTQYVAYYILPGFHPFAALPLGSNQQIRSLLGTPVYVTRYLSGGDTVTTVNGSLVQAIDLPASNGLIEVLSSVPEPQVCTSLWQRMQKDPSLAYFTAAVQRAGLSSLFSAGDSALTILAPSNYAFSQLITAINHTPSLVSLDSILLVSPAVLKGIILNHVVRGIYFANDFTHLDTSATDSLDLILYNGDSVQYVPNATGNFFSGPCFFSATQTQQYGQYYDPGLGQYVAGYFGPVFPAGAEFYSPYFYDEVPAAYQDRPTGNGVLHVISSVLVPE